VRVKICCIQSISEARLAVDAGASLLGLVGPMPSGPGPIPLEVARSIAAWCPPGVTATLLTSETETPAIAAQVEETSVTCVQLTDRVDDLPALRSALPHTKLVQVVHVRDARAIDEARALALEVDALLLDSGDPYASTKVLGGTGRTHDWAVSAELVRAVDVPVFLAGGLHAENVGEAIATVRPWGVDVCSGVRVDGVLDLARLSAFVRAASNV